MSNAVRRVWGIDQRQAAQPGSSRVLRRTFCAHSTSSSPQVLTIMFIPVQSQSTLLALGTHSMCYAMGIMRFTPGASTQGPSTQGPSTQGFSYTIMEIKYILAFELERIFCFLGLSFFKWDYFSSFFFGKVSIPNREGHYQMSEYKVYQILDPSIPSPGLEQTQNSYK